MSILIEGMKAPTKCLKCPMYDDYNYSCKLCSFKIPARYNYEDATRPEWCPLVELPDKHGDLIDKDELKKEFPKDTDWEYPVNTNEYVCETIDKAKPVIKAEDG